MIKITIPEIPVAKGRPKVTIVKGHAWGYTGKKTRLYESTVRLIARQHRPKELLTGALKITMYFWVPIPKSFSRKKRLLALSGELRPITRPDLDNYAKVKDALNGIIWHDDSQIVSEHLSKWYSDDPRTVIHIFDLSECKQENIIKEENNGHNKNSI